MKKSYTFIMVIVLLAEFATKAQITVDLKAFLEGPFNVSEMNTALYANGYLPLLQPYSGPPWNYMGTESVTAIPNTDVVDWVLVELRETAGDASTAYEGDSLSSQAGFLLKDGHIVTIDGASPLQFNCMVTYKLYSVVYHRNHLSVLSGDQLINNAGVYSWDYTIGENQAYGGSLAHKELTTGIWGMVAGDGNADGQINNVDKNDVWKPQSGSSGYKAGDFNLSGVVDNIDKIDFWSINSGNSTQVPGPWHCGLPIADIRDGQVYSTVQIGTQCWMAENLNFGAMISFPQNQLNNGAIEKYCYNNNMVFCDEYGGLYQWDEMMQYVSIPGVRGICQEGWHLPTESEWNIIVNFLGGGGIAGGAMKEVGYAHWYWPNTGATNSSGFTALGGGNTSNNFHNKNILALLWSSSESGSNAWSRQMENDNDDIVNYAFSKNYGFSVRCLKDN